MWINLSLGLISSNLIIINVLSNFSLEFARDGDAFAPPAMIPGRELVRRLEEKRREREGGREEDDRHPQDRDDNGERITHY